MAVNADRTGKSVDLRVQFPFFLIISNHGKYLREKVSKTE